MYMHNVLYICNIAYDSLSSFACVYACTYLQCVVYSQSVLWRISWPSVCTCLPWSHCSTRHPPTCWSMSWHSSQRYVCTAPTHIRTYIIRLLLYAYVHHVYIHTFYMVYIHTYVCIIRTHASVDVLHCVFMYVHMLLYEYMHVYVRMFVLEECRALWGKPECPSPP